MVSGYMKYSCIAKCKKKKCITGDSNISETKKNLFKNSVARGQVNDVVIPSIFVKKQKVNSGKTLR